jgi:hypothetical protein
LVLPLLVFQQPGAMTGSIFIFQAWKSGMIGGADVKLWLGLLWFILFAGENIPCMSISLIDRAGTDPCARTYQEATELGIKAPGVASCRAYGLLAYSTKGPCDVHF